MYLHHDAKLMYLANPRTATKSTAQALISVGFSQVDNVCASPSGLHHLTVKESERSTDGWTVFCTVRNHWDAVVSWMCFWDAETAEIAESGRLWTVDQMRRSLDGNKWVADDRLWHRHVPDSKLLMRFESLGTDLGTVLCLAGIQMPVLQHLDANEIRGGRPYQRFFTVETQDYVAERFAEEIRELGYSYETDLPGSMTAGEFRAMQHPAHEEGA